jgi:hypothetical protein
MDRLCPRFWTDLRQIAQHQARTIYEPITK